jgi:putative ABC transport system ATP-binding protein
MLRSAADEDGQTIVMVTHDERAAAIADRVISFADGRVVGDRLA